MISAISRRSRTKVLRFGAVASVVALSVYFAQRMPDSKGAVAAAAQGKGKKGNAPAFWLRDYAGARAQARESGKPIFVVIRCER